MDTGQQTNSGYINYLNKCQSLVDVLDKLSQCLPSHWADEAKNFQDTDTNLMIHFAKSWVCWKQHLPQLPLSSPSVPAPE